MITTAVILAAGMGTRFGDMTENMPKGFVMFKHIPMIERSIQTLISCGISRIIIGTGYKQECYNALRKKYPQIECVFSPLYAETNSMYTLYNCRNAIGTSDFLLLESDLVFNARAITTLLESNYPSAMLITSVRKFQDQYYVQMNANGELTMCSTDKSQLTPSGELVGIHKISHSFYQIMVDDYAGKWQSTPKLGYEYELLYVSRNITPLYVVKDDKCIWYEIDDIRDLSYAEDHICID